MADLISEILLSLVAVEDIGPGIVSFFDSIFAFLGDEGSSLLIEIIPNLRPQFVDIIYESIEVDSEGIISGWTRTINIAGVDSAKLLRFMQILSQKMAEQGYQILSTRGKQLLVYMFERFQDYAPYITAGATGIQISQIINDFKAQQDDLPKSMDTVKPAVLP